MNNQPKLFDKENFIEFLKNNGITNGVLNRIDRLPEVINHKKNKYFLNIVVSWHKEGNTYYEFELNYYSKENMEFLLTYKIFNNIENSLNFLECELKKRGLIDLDIICDN